MHILSIEGNIGTGKSTLIKIIENLLNSLKNGKKPIPKEFEPFLIKDRDGKYIYDSVEIITEPVDKWIELKDSDGENILDKFYKDQKRWSYSFQMNAFITRSKEILDHSDKKLVIVERSVLTDRNVFAKLLFNDSKISEMEWKLYNEWFLWLTSSFNIMPNKIVYLKASPDVSFKRIKKRSRTEESTIPFSYIQKVSQEHDNWLNNYENLTLIDADIEFENNHKRTVEILKTIFDEINILLS